MPGPITFHRILLISCAAAITPLGCSVTEPEPDRSNIEGPSIAINGGFERGLTFPDDWRATVLARTYPYGTFTWDSTESHSGRHSVRLSIREDHPSELIQYNWTQPLTAGVLPGRKYQMEAWFKTNGSVKRAFIAVQFWDLKEISFFGVVSTQAAAASTGWTRMVLSFRVPETGERLRIRAGLEAPTNAGGTVWFDDIGLYLVDRP